MNTPVQIRDVIDSDLPIFFEHQREPDANRMAAFASRNRDDFMAHWKNKILANKSNFKQTIVFDSQVVGNILCWQQEGKWLVGYWIGQEFWGKGIATSALQEFLRVLSMRPLHAYVSKNNAGSIRVLEKCGFTIAGHEAEEVLMVCKF